jgi:LysM repeat protein
MTTRQSTAGQTASSNREPAANRQYVVVRRGQSVYRIAAQNGLTAQELARLNNISINTPIHPGQQLRVR